VIRLNKWVSKSPTKIIYNSQQSMLQHKEFGLYSGSSICIPNGVDLTKFALGMHQVETEFSWADKGLSVVGLVARYHPMKDHAGFIKAALVLCEQKRNVAFVLVGSNVDVANKALTELIPERFQSRFYFLGERADVERVLQTIDCLVLASAWGEAFPNVLIEAMSSSRPCITTDVGDAAYIVGDTGLVVPPKDPSALAGAMLQMLDKPAETRHALGQLARLRIEEKFNLTSVVDMYASLYDELLLTR
jgi:glycosyltransferase involved in cell wall biosynthesis